MENEKSETPVTGVTGSAPAAPAPKKRFYVTESWGYVLIMGFILLLLGQILGDEFTKLLLRLNQSDAFVICMQYFSFIGIWAVILLTMLLKRNRFLFSLLGAKREGNNLKMFLIGLAIGFGGNMICVICAMLNGNIHIYFGSLELLPMIAAFFCVLVQSAAEELVCRLWCYEKIKKHHSPLFAVLSTALFFASLHLFNNGMSVIPFLNIALVGILYALVVYYFDSLWATFAMHAAWNYTQNLLMGLPNSGIVTPFSMFKLDAATATYSWAYDPAFGVEGSVTSVVIHVLAIAALLYFFRSRNKGLLKKTESAD